MSTQADSSRYLQRGAALLILGVLGGFAADYLFNVTLSRRLHPVEYGDFKVAYGFASILGVAVLLGGDRAASRFLSAGLARGDNGPVREYLRFYGAVALGLSALGAIATLALSLMHVGPVDLEDHHPLLWASFTVPVIAVGALLARVLQAARRVGSATLPWRIGFPLVKTALIVAVGFYFGTLHASVVIALAGFAAVLVSAFQWRRIRSLGLVRIARRPGGPSPRELLSISAPMMASMLLTMALGQLDLFLFEALGDEHSVGHFAAAATTAHAVVLVQVTIIGLFAPLIGPAMEAGKEASQALFRRVLRVMFIAATTAMGVLTLVGESALGLFGEGYDDVASALKLLGVGYLVWALAAPASVWLQYAGRGRVVTLISLAALLTDAACNYWWIPPYGATGAAAATTAAMSLGAAAIWLVFLRDRGLAGR